MPIEIMGVPDDKGHQRGPFVATLFIVFNLSDDGRYKPMTQEGGDGSFVYIEEVTPMEWLYNEAKDAGFDSSLEEFIDMGSVTIIENSLAAGLQSGTLVKLGMINPVQRIVYQKISDPAVYKRLRDVSAKLFETISGDLGKNLNKQIKNDAVKFSMQTRNPTQLKKVQKWFDFGMNYLMSSTAIAQRADDIHNFADLTGGKGGPQSKIFKDTWEQFGMTREASLAGDPFWYLWAAPYVSRTRPGEGGGVTGAVAGEQD